LPPDPSATSGTSEVKSHEDVSSSGVVLMSIPPNQYSKPLALGMIRIGSKPLALGMIRIGSVKEQDQNANKIDDLVEFNFFCFCYK
jgi:hypothetical protein